MIPNARNTSLFLLSVRSVTDSIGTKSLEVSSKKEVYGIIRSITTSEYESAKSQDVNFEFKVVLQAPSYDGSKYALLNNVIYKVERTYIAGQFIELYFVTSDLNKEEINGC